MSRSNLKFENWNFGLNLNWGGYFEDDGDIEGAALRHCGSSCYCSDLHSAGSSFFVAWGDHWHPQMLFAESKIIQ